MATPRICVVGAGVNGLCSAVCIQQSISGSEVTIIADKFTVDTLSDGAAGLFRPSNSIRGPNPNSIKEWATDSYAFYKSIATSKERETAGIKEISGYLLAEEHEEITRSSLLEEILPCWKIISAQELKKFPGNWKFGSYFTTLLIETRRFLPWMTKRFLSNGGKFIEKSILSFEELCDGQYDVIINCTGFGAKYLCNDSRLIPIRGQVFKVKAPWVKEFFYGDLDTYIIPGFDWITLGGTRQYHSYNTKINWNNSAEIWHQCCSLVPELKDAVVDRQFVGLRPHRDVVRVELDNVTNRTRNKIFPLIHNYGHGGYGVTLAWGCAVEVTKLTQLALNGSNKIIAKL